MEKHTIKIGCSTYHKRLTEKQAMRLALKLQDKVSKKAKFIPVLFRATMEMNGWDGIRINYARP